MYILVDQKLSNQLESLQTKTIEQVRENGIDKQTLERIAAERITIQKKQDEMRQRLPGNFISLRNDKEQKTLLFTGEYQKVEVPSKDWVTKEIIPGKMSTRYRFQVYDISDPDNSSEPAIFERGLGESERILYWISQNRAELTILRNGQPNSTKTTYDIFPAGR